MGNSELVREISTQRAGYCFPAGFRRRTEQVAQALLGLLFPHFAHSLSVGQSLEREIEDIESELAELLTELPAPHEFSTPELVGALLSKLASIRAKVLADANFILANDPAAPSLDEVLLVYPGLFAVAVYRLAHELWDLHVPILPRLFTEWAHHRTGIDIHPGAEIGYPFLIDHGTGIVIGETATLGDYVTLYQGVTLGSLSVSKNLASTKRHPTLEDYVLVYAHATILGGDTVIGAGSIIGGNVWITESVPPKSVVTRRSEIRVRPDTEPADVLDWSI